MFRPLDVQRLTLVVAVALTALCATSAHAQQDGGGMFGPRKPKPTENTPAKPNAPVELKPLEKHTGGWSIVLAAFRNSNTQRATRDDAPGRLMLGDTQEADARAMLSKVVEQKELAGAFVESRGGGKSTVVAVGRFADPSSADALAKLEKVRTIEIGGKKPFAGAFLAPPGELTNLGQRPEFNLVRAKEQYGERAVYTLQVAVYGRKDIIDGQKRNPTEEELKEARKAAEEAAATLRQEGELAFFYHGPKYSSVTVGAWNDNDFGKKGDTASGERARLENPDLTAVRQRFPQNLYNGAGVKVKTKDNKEEIQPSFVVRIPER